MITNMRKREHREAKRILEWIEHYKYNYSTIHYSCKSFCDTGLIPRITSIAICDVYSGQSKSFSIHISALLLKILPEDIPENYDKIEEDMLRRYFEHLKTNEKTTFIHWNMRDCTYGFHTIELRGKLFCLDAVFRLPNERKTDLSRLFAKLYGQEPQFKSLIELNYPLSRAFMDGKEEAIAFDKGEYVRLHQSTSVKAANISKLLDLAINGDLKTNVTRRSMYGLSVDGITATIRDTWYLSLTIWLISVFNSRFYCQSSIYTVGKIEL